MTNKNMKCGICFAYSVNKMGDHKFKCGNCGHIYNLHKMNYLCPECDVIWRENDDGSKFEGWIQLNFVYEHTERMCPDCRKPRIGRVIFE